MKDIIGKIKALQHKNFDRYFNLENAVGKTILGANIVFTRISAGLPTLLFGELPDSLKAA